MWKLLLICGELPAVSVYGPQIFELLGYGVQKSEYLTQANYLSYLALMTFAWLLIDAVGRRTVMLGGSSALVVSFILLTVFGGLAMNRDNLHLSADSVGVPGIVTLFIATGAFGIGWLVPPWLIPTGKIQDTANESDIHPLTHIEIYPTTARAQGTAVSVIIWGLANFAITLLTPILFNNFQYWIFLVFALSNLFAGIWTWLYCPETGGRSFEENQAFFKAAKAAETWRVSKVEDGTYTLLPYPKPDGEQGETQPLLRRVAEQI